MRFQLISPAAAYRNLLLFVLPALAVYLVFAVLAAGDLDRHELLPDQRGLG